MIRIKNELLKRTIFAIILIAIFIPTFVITKYGGTPGRILAAVVFIIIGMYALFEVLFVLKIKREHALLTTLVVPFFFALPVDNFISIIRLNNSVDNLSLLAKRAISGWEGWVIALAFAFIPLAMQFLRRVTINFITQMIIIFVFMLLPAFTKLFWVYNIKGLEVLAFFILIAAISDMGGYFGGRFFGTKWFKGKKLAPHISPKKTYAGFVFGTALAIIFAIIYGYFTHIWSDFKSNELVVTIIFGVLGPLAATVGDLFFSLVKRLVQVKDFSNIIPGHGGLMDRLDAMSFVFLLAGVFLLFVFN